MTKRFLFFLLAGLYLMAPVRGQILAPELICIQNDTLSWNPANNPCGPFISYQIYFSNSPQGPYSLLADIPNSSQTQFYHANPGGTFYYFMQTNADCPGLTRLSSDTLDNLQPEQPEIIQATVVNGKVQLNWHPSKSPEVSSYLVYKATPNGSILIATVADTTFTDPSSQPDIKLENYNIVAQDDCGNTSLFSIPHTTIFMKLDVSKCDQQLNLSWNLYGGWNGAASRQEILLSVDGGAFTPVDTVSGTAIQASVKITDESKLHCILVKAVSPAGETFSESNVICVDPEIVTPVTVLAMTNASFQMDGNLYLTWRWNPNADIKSYRIQRSRNQGTWEDLLQNTVSFPLSSEVQVQDPNGPGTEDQMFYRIISLDSCDVQVTSNFAGNLLLQVGKDPSGFPQLTWDAYKNSTGKIFKYRIFRIANGQVKQIAEVDSLTTNYLDDEDLGDVTDLCYFVGALATVYLPDGKKDNVQTLSNKVCLFRDSRVFMPNAFAPRGKNQLFRPKIQFAEDGQFEMQIYNRWGRKIFTTQDASTGWDGKVDGELQPQGTYIYLVRFVQPSGQVEEIKGSFFLLR